MDRVFHVPGYFWLELEVNRYRYVNDVTLNKSSNLGSILNEEDGSVPHCLLVSQSASIGIWLGSRNYLSNYIIIISVINMGLLHAAR